MEEQKIPYLVRLAAAMVERDREKFEKIMQGGIQDLMRKIMYITQGYTRQDLPLVIAVLQITAQALSSTLSDEERHIVECIVDGTECIAFDVAELNRQMKQEEHGEN